MKISKYYLIISFSFLATAILISACQPQEKTKEEIKKEKKQSLNPNGDSELALLMRDMYDELATVQKNIANGEAIQLNVDHGKILTAHATEPEKAASPEFKAFANQYLQFVEQIESAEPAALEVHYQNLLASCLSCHQVLCPGPMVKIKKLQLKKQANL